MAIFNKTFLFLLLACYSFKGLASETKESEGQPAASAISELAVQEKKVFFVFEDGERHLVPSFIYNKMNTIKDLVDLENSDILGNRSEDQHVIDIPIENISKRALSFIIELMNAIEEYDEEVEVTDEGIRVYPKELVHTFFTQLIKSKAGHNYTDALNFLYEIYHFVDFLDLRLIDTKKGDAELLGIITEIVAGYLLKIDDSVDLDTLPFNTNYSFTKELRRLLVPHLKECSPLLVTRLREAAIVTRIADGQQICSVRRGKENGHQEDIYSHKLSFDNSLLVTYSDDAIIVTRIADGQQICSVRRGKENGHQEDIVSYELSFDNSLLVTHSDDAIIVIRIADGQQIYSVRRGEENGHQEIIGSVQLSSDSSLLVTQSCDAVIVTRIIDKKQMLSVKPGKENFHDTVWSAKLISDNSLLVTQDNYYFLVTRIVDKEKVFSARNGEEYNQTLFNYYQSLLAEKDFNGLIRESNLSLNQIYQVIHAQKQGFLLPYIKNVITPEGNKDFVFQEKDEDYEQLEVFLERALQLFDKYDKK